MGGFRRRVEDFFVKGVVDFLVGVSFVVELAFEGAFFAVQGRVFLLGFVVRRLGGGGGVLWFRLVGVRID